MNLLVHAFLGLVTVIVLLQGCSDTGKPKPPRKAAEPALPAATAVQAPAFNADSAYAYVQRQVAFGPRIPGRPAHRAAADWMVAQLQARGAEVLQQTADVQSSVGRVPVRNLIARFHPQHTRRIMLSAHYDTRPLADREPKSADARRPFDGANDGASGVGVLLEIARQLQTHDPGVGVDLFLWDAEDMGQTEAADSYCIGSQHWARNKMPKGYNPQLGILLDMVGADGATFTLEGGSKQYAPQVQQQVWQTAHALGYGSYFLYAPDVEITDDHYYLNTLAGIPTINIIHRDLAAGDFFKCHHKRCDDMSNIARPTLKAVGQTVLTYLFQQGAQGKPAAAQPSGDSAAQTQAADSGR